MDQSVNGKTLDVKRKTQTRNVIPSAVEGSIHDTEKEIIDYELFRLTIPVDINPIAGAYPHITIRVHFHHTAKTNIIRIINYPFMVHIQYT